VAEVILGHYPDYIAEAQRRGARYFSLPADVWDRMPDQERWEQNRRFLDRAIEWGDEIILATSLGDLRKGSYFEKELQYLASRGYRPAADMRRLVRPEEP
jgi:hypothetical protein